MYSDALLDIFGEQQTQAYGLDAVQAVGLNPFENFESVVFKVRELEGSHGSGSTADNNNGARGKPSHEDM